MSNIRKYQLATPMMIKYRFHWLEKIIEKTRIWKRALSSIIKKSPFSEHQDNSIRLHPSYTTPIISQQILDKVSEPILVINANTLTVIMANDSAKNKGIAEGGSLRNNEKWNEIFNYENYRFFDLINTGYTGTLELTRIDNFGHIRYETIDIYPIRSDNKTKRLVALRITDQTEIKEVLKQLKSARKQAKMHLDIMRHDLINIFQIITSSTELLAHNKENNESCSNILEIINDSVNRAVNLIRKIQWFDTNKDENVELVSIQDALDFAIERIYHNYRDTQLQILINSTKVDYQINAQISEAFFDIIENSIVHNTAKNRTVWINLHYTRDQIIIEISDNGPGLSEGMKQSVLDSEKRISGTGLHHAVEIITSLGGTIQIGDRISGNPSEGLKVTFTLPKLTKGRVLNQFFKASS
ncbi:MAG: HAMP domain-containing histidine kinase [Candidatus Thorarchaeota archaeon]|nr:HAMP domain-containing histidine kinase [Candidatus Thorarchaeota archaeon]